MKYVKISEKNNLLREIHSKAILNVDKNALDEYYIQKNILKKQNEEKEETKMRLLKLEEDMSEIKNLLMEIAKLRGKECQ